MATTIHYIIVRCEDGMAYTDSSTWQSKPNGTLTRVAVWAHVDSLRVIEYDDYEKAEHIAEGLRYVCDIHKVETTVTRTKMERD